MNDAATGISIRPMTFADYDQVLAVWSKCEGLGKLEDRAEFRQFLDRNPGLSPVAEFEGHIVGAIWCGHDGRRGYLYHLGVDPSLRRQGIAGKLVDACLRSLASLNISRCSVHLFVTNQLAVDFWQGIGWLKRDDLYVMKTDFGNG